MKYEYFIVIGALGFLYLIFEKVAGIAQSLKVIEKAAENLNIQNVAIQNRLIDIESTIGDCVSHLQKIEYVADNHQRVILDQVPSRPNW